MRFWHRPRSVRVRLTLAYVAAMMAVLAVYGGVVYAIVQNNMSKALDSTLREDFIWPKEMWSEDMVRELLEGRMLGTEDTDGEASPWLMVWNADGSQLLYRSYSARVNRIEGAAALARLPDGRIRQLPEMIPPYRILTGTSRISGAEFVVQVAAPETEMRAYLGDLLVVMLLGLPVAVALAGFGGYTLARRALAPVDRMAERARLITAERLKERLPIDNPNDELGRLAAVFNETLTRLESSFDQMRRFSADASHELRTPLTAMRSVGEIGLRGKKDVAAYREIIGSMLEEVERLSTLVDRLLTLSRSDTGEVALSKDHVDLAELAEDVTSQLDVLAEEKQQSLQVEHDGAATCLGDRMVLRQALMNLVDNAIKYSPAGARIVVRTGRTPEGAVTLDVSDTGPGIPAELHPRVFDRFYRVDRARSRENGGGTGLGLSIARWAVEANGGRLTLESNGGPGATFRITLPHTA